MRLIVTSHSLRSSLQWVQRILFAGGICLLAYCGFALIDGWMFQAAEGRRLDQLIENRQLAAAVERSVWPSGLVGRLAIPRLGVSVIVTEGVDSSSLRRAAGHIPGTALPGQPGNAAISAHRDTFFRPLRNIRKNDIITVTTPLGEYSYRVVSTRIVSPLDVAVLDPGPGESLTLVTCYPFYFIGSAPERFIVRAERVGNSS